MFVSIHTFLLKKIPFIRSKKELLILLILIERLIRFKTSILKFIINSSYFNEGNDPPKY